MYPDCAETGSVSIVSSTRCNDDTEINKTSKKTYTQLNEVQLAAFCFIYKLVRMVGSFLLVSILSSPTLFFFYLYQTWSGSAWQTSLVNLLSSCVCLTYCVIIYFHDPILKCKCHVHHDLQSTATVLFRINNYLPWTSSGLAECFLASTLIIHVLDGNW